MPKTSRAGASGSQPSGTSVLDQRLVSALATLRTLDELARAEQPNNEEIRSSLDILVSNLDHLQRAKDAVDIQLPRELVHEFVDEGRNPDLWAQAVAGRCEASRRRLDGRSSALRNLGSVLEGRIAQWRAEQ